MQNNKLDINTLNALLQQNIISQSEYDNLIGANIEPTKVDVSVVESYHSFCRDLEKKELSKTTVDGYKLGVKKFCEYLLNIEDFDTISKEINLPIIDRTIVLDFLNKLASNGFSYSSLRTYKLSVKKYLEFLNLFYKTSMPDIESLEIPQAKEEIDIEALPDYEVREIANHALSTRDKVLILLAYEAGLRRQEIVDIKKEDVDYDNNQIRIYNKGKLDRIVSFSDETKRLLIENTENWEMQVWDINNNRQLKAMNGKSEYIELEISEYLFQTVKSPQMSYSTVFKALKDASFEYYSNLYKREGFSEIEATKMAEIKTSKISVETLRHSKRAFLFSEGKTLEQVQAIMGDENRWVCKRYLKIAQQLYPNKF